MNFINGGRFLGLTVLPLKKQSIIIEMYKQYKKYKKTRKTNRRRKQLGGNPQTIVKHLQSFQMSKTHPGIFYAVNEANVEKNNRICIIGPRYPKQDDADYTNLTYPYEECLFFFDMHFPSEYPHVPPSMKFINSYIFTDNFRYHPNLYQSFHGPSGGKVCLSILGTWAGPGWEPTMNIESTLTTVQSLLGPNPLHNEPSYENLLKDDKNLISYNHSVFYRSVQFTLDIYTMILSKPEDNLPLNIQPFVEELKESMFSSIKFLIGKLARVKSIYPEGFTTIKELHHMSDTLDYTSLYDKVFAFFMDIPEELKVEIASENTSVQAEKNAKNIAAAERILDRSGINTRAVVKNTNRVISNNDEQRAKELEEEAISQNMQASMFEEDRDKKSAQIYRNMAKTTRKRANNIRKGLYIMTKGNNGEEDEYDEEGENY